MIKWKALLTAYSAIMWPYWLIASADIIDSSFAIAYDRAEKCGKLLAEALVQNAHGNRPVTLVGVSVGCVMIMRCLQILSDLERYDIVENVYFFGSTLSSNLPEWQQAAECVAGEFVNAYSCNDWLLGFLFRSHKLSSVSGLGEVLAPEIRNVDCSQWIETHLDYGTKLRTLMSIIVHPKHRLVAYTPNSRKLMREGLSTSQGEGISRPPSEGIGPPTHT
eukprot:NODE_1368_length_1184_cov_53.614097_g1124_i0.p1 GENE.NODE_1368_length_1184_cov_53.614097_g1124_i0~~NODE_1368_length_1184_cov_53.614097_g1124_i0.p1  ORF type:complete len:220 (+),score=42.90 NODE_1368_length_1184_cov_53.614097_g1124_i0:373-1032(+)